MRLALGLSWGELAARVGISRATIFRRLVGSVQDIRLNTFVRLAEALQMSVSRLLLDQEEPLPREAGEGQSESFADRLRRLMVARGVSPGQLARAIGVSRSTLYRYLRGDAPPRILDLIRMARALSTSPVYLASVRVQVFQEMDAQRLQQARWQQAVLERHAAEERAFQGAERDRLAEDAERLARELAERQQQAARQQASAIARREELLQAVRRAIDGLAGETRQAAHRHYAEAVDAWQSGRLHAAWLALQDLNELTPALPRASRELIREALGVVSAACDAARQAASEAFAAKDTAAAERDSVECLSFLSNYPFLVGIKTREQVSPLPGKPPNRPKAKTPLPAVCENGPRMRYRQPSQ